MGIFSFFKSINKKKSVDLTDFKFLSNEHVRYENGLVTSVASFEGDNSWRGIRIRSSDKSNYYVTIYNMNKRHPVWGDNIQMAEKRMELVTEEKDKIVLRGNGFDSMGASFADYGITIHILPHREPIILKVTLHLYDRNIDIEYSGAPDRESKIDTSSHRTDFEHFKTFTHSWNFNMTLEEKIGIASMTDVLNNQGCDAMENENYNRAISLFEQALMVMPNNDDALKNLALCYTQQGNLVKRKEVIKKLNYLSGNSESSS